jgi:phosphatidylethanolamine/phosphatidyl-N-methylethanolamine N-methyltransferase
LGGEGFHVPFVKHDFTSYYLTDISNRTLTRDALNLKVENRLISMTNDAEHLAFKTSCFDRVIFMCVLHHLNDPYKALQESLRVVRNKGLITIYLPCDPGFAYRQFRKIALRSNIKDLDLNYNLINAKEHHKHVHGLEIFIKEVLKESKIVQKAFPFRIKLHDLNIFNVYQMWVTK